MLLVYYSFKKKLGLGKQADECMLMCLLVSIKKYEKLDKLGLSVLGYGPVEGCGVYGNLHLSSVKGYSLTSSANGR
jgi:hypothetical protein